VCAPALLRRFVDTTAQNAVLERILEKASPLDRLREPPVLLEKPLKPRGITQAGGDAA